MKPRDLGIGMTSERTRMRLIERLRAERITDERVLTAIGETPRHVFVDEALASRAYEDTPLPIGFGQTISNPYIVARMTELLRGGRRVAKALEVGTGCGYQTAILAKIAKEVYSIERIAALLDKARQNLRQLRITNVRFKHGDGVGGMVEAAPFDGIMVTAACAKVPERLKAQLADGGRLVFPLGDAKQWLYLIERKGEQFVQSKLDAVRFVPMLPGAVR
jgi:protein-L-isoaspartate(D-aspartate) O-methyltransferase